MNTYLFFAICLILIILCFFKLENFQSQLCENHSKLLKKAEEYNCELNNLDSLSAQEINNRRLNCRDNQDVIILNQFEKNTNCDCEN